MLPNHHYRKTLLVAVEPDDHWLCAVQLRAPVSASEPLLKPAAIPLPLRWAIVGFSMAFWGSIPRCSTAREASETLDHSSGGPNGIRTRVSALRGPCPGPLDDGAARTMRQHRASGWLGEEDSNPRYVVQSHASYH